MTLGHPEIRSVFPVAGILMNIVKTDCALSAKSRTENVCRARHRKILKMLARNSRKRIKHVRASIRAINVIEKRPELSSRYFRPGIGKRLHQFFLIELRREQLPDAVDSFKYFRLLF